ncbi:MAG: rhomboid family intramembrane serine protease [Gloeobacteraceae cyanobacterium ES-bin-144]|nr:rhomboid family intramembrane serine protease [Verrucomicrobiales bacterium]
MLPDWQMGIADRDYIQNQPRGGGFMEQLTPVVKWLLILNFGIYFVDMAMGNPLRNFGAFAIQSAIFEFRLWEFVTFQFLHGSLGHVLFNCMGIYFFAPFMERWWGSKKFLIYYLLCGAAGAAFFTLLIFLGLVPGNYLDPLVGASAGIYGILIGVAFIAPNLRVRLLFPPIELSMRQLAISLIVLSVGLIVFGIGGNEGGEAGHLGGAIFGFFLMRYPQQLGSRSEVEILRPKAFGQSYESKLRPRSTMHMDEDSAVDRILEKVHREGMQSLTQVEREILQKVSQRQNSDS